ETRERRVGEVSHAGRLLQRSHGHIAASGARVRPLRGRAGRGRWADVRARGLAHLVHGSQPRAKGADDLFALEIAAVNRSQRAAAKSKGYPTHQLSTTYKGDPMITIITLTAG